MKKKMTAAILAAMMTMAMCVPVMAGPVETAAAAQAESNKRISDYLVYQTSLQNFQKGEVAKGEAQKAAGIKAQQENFARIAAFQKSEIAKGEAQEAKGQAEEKANFERIALFQTMQKGKAEAANALRAEAQRLANIANSL